MKTSCQTFGSLTTKKQDCKAKQVREKTFLTTGRPPCWKRPPACLYLVPLCKLRERFSACSFCLSASSSWQSLCFSSADRAWPALTKASGVCKSKQRKLEHWTEGTLYKCKAEQSQSNLVSEHEGDYFQHVHAPLLLALSTCNKLDQVIKTAHVNGPQHPVMDAGIIIHLLQPDGRPKIEETVK